MLRGGTLRGVRCEKTSVMDGLKLRLMFSNQEPFGVSTYILPVGV